MKSERIGRILKIKNSIIMRSYQQYMASLFNRLIPDIYIVCIYFFLTIIFTYKIIIEVPANGDAFQILWFMWWFKKSILSFTNPYFTTYLFYPSGVSLAFSDTTPFNSILSIPLQLIFGSIWTYRILILVSFIIAGYGTYLLVKYLTDNMVASFISGLIFMFSPYHFAHIWGGHLNIATIGWIPFYVLFLFKTVRESKNNNIIYSSFFLLLVALSDYYYLVFMVIFTIIFIIYSIVIVKNNFDIKYMIKRISMMIILFGLMLIPFVYPLLKELSRSNYMYYGGFTEYSADLLGFFIPASFHPIFGPYLLETYSRFSGNTNEYTVFIGYTVLFLAFWSIKYWKKKEVKFWTITGIIFFILSLGPVLHFNGKLYESIKLPYLIIEIIPIISIARVPSRWDILVMLSLAVLAGYGLKNILDRIKDKKKVLVVAIIFSGLIMFEYLADFGYVSDTKIPEFYYNLKNDSGNFVILEIPSDMYSDYPYYMYYQTLHEKKLVGGYVSRTPPGMVWPEDIIKKLEEDKDNGKSILKNYDIKYIILHKNFMDDSQLTNTENLLQNTSIRQIYNNDQLAVYIT